MIRALAMTCAALAALDIVSTRLLLAKPGFHEAGPLWRRLPLSPDLLLAAQLSAYAFAGWLLWTFAPPHPAVWVFPAVVLAYAVASNAQRLLGH